MSHIRPALLSTRPLTVPSAPCKALLEVPHSAGITIFPWLPGAIITPNPNSRFLLQGLIPALVPEGKVVGVVPGFSLVLESLVMSLGTGCGRFRPVPQYWGCVLR